MIISVKVVGHCSQLQLKWMFGWMDRGMDGGMDGGMDVATMCSTAILSPIKVHTEYIKHSNYKHTVQYTFHVFPFPFHDYPIHTGLCQVG